MNRSLPQSLPLPLRTAAAACLLTLPLHAAAPEGVLANSVTGFSNVQGKNGWLYGYLTAPFGVADFTAFPRYGNYPGFEYLGDVWLTDPAVSWSLLSADAAHPNGADTSLGRAAVVQHATRRWICLKEGPVTILGHTADVAPEFGNGVVIRILVDGAEIFSRVVENGAATLEPYAVKTTLRSGSLVDFTVDPRDGNDHADTTRFTAFVVEDAPFPAWRQAVTSAGTPPAATRFEPVWGGKPEKVDTGVDTRAWSYEFIVNAGPAGSPSTLLGAPEAERLLFGQSGGYGPGFTDYRGDLRRFTRARSAMRRDTHVVFTSNGDDTTLYVDGKPRRAFPGSSPRLARDSWLAGLPAENGGPFTDRLDGFILGFASYGAELSAGEVREHFLATGIISRETIPASRAAGPVPPAAPGDGAWVIVENGLGHSGVPRPSSRGGWEAERKTILFTSVVDFPCPGSTVPEGSSFERFFQSSVSAPPELAGVPAANFQLRVQGLLKVTRGLDLDPLTPEIELELGVGSDDGFFLMVGGEEQGSAAGRTFAETWMPVTFEAPGLYPVILLYAANDRGPSGLELSWKTARGSSPEIIPGEFLYRSLDGSGR